MYGMILYLAQCESLCRIPVFPPLTGCDRLVIRAKVTDTQKLLSAVPLPDDPYVAVRQTQLVDTDTESDPEEAPSEVEELQSVGSRVPLIGEEFEGFLSRYGTRIDSSIHHIIISISELRGEKRYRGTPELILDTDSEGDELGEVDTKEDEEDESDESQGLEDAGFGLEEEEADQAVLVVETALSKSLRLGYGALRRHELAVEEDQVPSTFEIPEMTEFTMTLLLMSPQFAPCLGYPPSPEWSLSSLLVSPSSTVVTSPTSSPVATPTATISVNIDRDVRELYTRSGVVRDEIFSQRYRFRSLECEQERTAVTFGALWRPVLALEAWAGNVDTRVSFREMRGSVATLEQEVRRVVCKWRDLPRKMEPRALNQVRFAWESLNECCYQYEQVRSAIHVEILTIVNTCGMSLVRRRGSGNIIRRPDQD
ncbi:hypothetical protein Tco_0161955 [Tanacetum coccineum]